MMGTETMTATEIREHLVSKACTDEAFRGLLISDPKAAIQAELGVTLPEDFTIEVHEEMQDTSHLVLPPAAGLNEGELRQAAGGRPRYLWDIPWPGS